MPPISLVCGWDALERERERNVGACLKDKDRVPLERVSEVKFPQESGDR